MTTMTLKNMNMREISKANSFKESIQTIDISSNLCGVAGEGSELTITLKTNITTTVVSHRRDAKAHCASAHQLELKCVTKR